MYIVQYADNVTKEDIPSLPKSARELIKRSIESRLTTAPIQYGKPLRRNLAGCRRIRVGDYRVVYRVDENAKTVYVLGIQHRKDIYDSF